MHLTQRNIVRKLVEKHRKPEHLTVHDIGSYDVNGTHRPDMEALGLKYIGYDISAGPNVDIVIEPYHWINIPAESCDIVISGSCLEHVEAPWMWALQAFRIVKHGGLLVVDTPFSHGEHRYPVDCFRYLPDGYRYLFTQWTAFKELDIGFVKEENDTDCFFAGFRP